MNYNFDKNIPYKFKDLTGLEDRCKIGSSIIENGKVIGGIFFEEQIIPIPYPYSAIFKNKTIKSCGLAAIELLPEYRGNGKGHAIVKQLLSEFECIMAAAQEEKAWDWWKKMGAEAFMAVFHPDDINNEDRKAHTIGFILGRDELSTKLFRTLFQVISSVIPQCYGATMKMPEIDFSKNVK